VNIVSLNVYPLSGVWRNVTSGVTQQEKVIMDRNKLELAVGETHLLYTSVLPYSAENKTLTWRTSNPSVASVTGVDSRNAIITGLGQGRAVITAATQTGGIAGTVIVEVGEFKTNLSGLSSFPRAHWVTTNDGISGSFDKDANYMSTYSAINFTYEADLKLDESGGAGSMIFRANADGSSGYYFNVDPNLKVLRLFYKDNGALLDNQILATVPKFVMSGKTYHAKIIVNGTNIKVYFDGSSEPVIDVNDISYSRGYFGLNVFGGKAYYQKVYASPSSSVSESVYKIVNLESGKVLEAAGVVNGSPIQIRGDIDAANQKWFFHKNEDGTYSVISESSDRVLDASGNSDGSILQIWRNAGYDNQRWIIFPNDDGTVTLKAVNSGKALKAAGGGTEDGTPVVIGEPDGSAGQKWQLVEPYLRNPAPSLNATAAPGSTMGTTKVTATAGQDNHLVVQVSASSMVVPEVGDAVPAGTEARVTNPYISASDISGVDATTNKYVGVYEVDSTGKVVKFTLLMLTSGKIAAATMPPTVTASSPAHRATDVAVDANLELTFSENVTAVSRKFIVIKKALSHSIIETIAADDAAKVTVSGATYTIHLSGKLDYSTTYEVLIDSGAFKDAANSDYAGIEAATWSFTTVAAPSTTAPLSSDAALSALSVNTGVSQVALSRVSEAVYSASVGNSITSVTVTATVYDSNATVTASVYNSAGALVFAPVNLTSGQPSIALPLGVGSYRIQLAVTAQDGTVKLYTITVTRANAEASSQPVSGAPTDAKSTIKLDGVYMEAKQEKADDGQPVMKVSVGADKLSNAFSSAKGSVITLEIKNTDPVVKVELPASALLDAASKRPGAIVQIIVDGATYSFPVSALRNVPKDAIITITIAKVSGKASDDVNAAARNLGAKLLLGNPVDFKTTVGGKEVTKFNGKYVERTLTLKSSADARKATAVWVDANNKMHFIPSVLSSDKGFVTIRSPHNSIYTVIESDQTFADLQGHWAKTDVELLANKLIIDGATGTTFAPDSKITRAEFAALLVRSLGLLEEKPEHPFRDVNEADWFAGAVGAAQQAGLIGGYEDGSFRPCLLYTSPSPRD